MFIWTYFCLLQSRDIPVQNVNKDDYDASGNYIGNSDIFKRINAMLDNTLDLTNIDQNARK